MDLLSENSHWIILALLLMFLAASICGFSFWFFRKKVSHKTLKKNHDVAGFTFSIFGVLYSVILGFTVINVRDHYMQTEKALYQESVLILDLYRGADFFLEPDRERIRETLHQFVNYIIDHWPQFGEKHTLKEVQFAMDRVWDSYNQIQVGNEKSKIWYERSISQLDNLMNIRLTREFSSWSRINPMMWWLLILGAIITIGFMFFFGLENFQSQMTMIVLLSSYITFILFLVYSLDHIYSGPSAIQPTVLEEVREQFYPLSHVNA